MKVSKIYSGKGDMVTVYIGFEGKSRADPPSKVLLILVRGKRESLISRTTSVRESKDGSIRVNLIMCPGNHEGGTGKSGFWKRARAIF